MKNKTEPTDYNLSMNYIQGVWKVLEHLAIFWIDWDYNICWWGGGGGIKMIHHWKSLLFGKLIALNKGFYNIPCQNEKSLFIYIYSFIEVYKKLNKNSRRSQGLGLGIFVLILTGLLSLCSLKIIDCLE